MTNTVISLPTKLAGRFKFEAIKRDSAGKEVSRRVAADWFDNLIVDAGLNNLGTQSIRSALARCRVGTGTTPPTISDTDLVSSVAFVGSPTETTGFTSSAPYYSWVRYVFTFPTGAAAGNLSEVAIQDGSNVLFSRALIVDGVGTPTTVVILSDEQLVVTYELRIYAATADVPFTIDISGTSYSGTLRPMQVGTVVLFSVAGTAGGLPLTNLGSGNSAAGTTGTALGAFTAAPTGTMVNSTGTFSASAYTTGNFYRDWTITWSLGQANVGSGITTLAVRSRMAPIQLSFSPRIPKTATKTMTLTFREGPWGRFTP